MFRDRFWITLAIFLALGCGIAGFWFWLYNKQLSEAEIGRVLDRYRSELGAIALAVPARTQVPLPGLESISPSAASTCIASWMVDSPT